ncbi:hypothetical protein, partial [Pseudonocardia lacus]|uniref:hypothetical protein n=1 Tax=Pseudonocardia lacus TaxID=2835865 RepID=UPI001BDCF87E
APEYLVLSYGDGGDMPAVQLYEGYCYQVAPAPGRTIDRGAARDCDQVHVSQVFRILGPYDATTPDLPLPDPAALRAYGIEACRLQFDALVVGDDRDRLAVTVLVPSAESFTHDTRSTPESAPAFGRRGVHCLLTAVDGSQLTGSRLRAP